MNKWMNKWMNERAHTHTLAPAVRSCGLQGAHLLLQFSFQTSFCETLFIGESERSERTTNECCWVGGTLSSGRLFTEERKKNARFSATFHQIKSSFWSSEGSNCRWGRLKCKSVFVWCTSLNNVMERSEKERKESSSHCEFNSLLQ